MLTTGRIEVKLDDQKSGSNQHTPPADAGSTNAAKRTRPIDTATRTRPINAATRQRMEIDKENNPQTNSSSSSNTSSKSTPSDSSVSKRPKLNVNFFRMTCSLLNKVTKDNFERMLVQIFAIENFKTFFIGDLPLFIEFFIEKFKSPEHARYLGLYSELCIALNKELASSTDQPSSKISRSNQKSSFLDLLVSECLRYLEALVVNPPEKSFDASKLPSSTPEEKEKTEELISRHNKMLQSNPNFVNFLGKLLEVDSVRSSLLKFVTDALNSLNNYYSSHLFNLIKIGLTALGKFFVVSTNEVDKKRFDTILDRFLSLKSSKTLLKIESFGIEDMENLRERGWVEKEILARMEHLETLLVDSPEKFFDASKLPCNTPKEQAEKKKEITRHEKMLQNNLDDVKILENLMKFHSVRLRLSKFVVNALKLLKDSYWSHLFDLTCLSLTVLGKSSDSLTNNEADKKEFDNIFNEFCSLKSSKMSSKDTAQKKKLEDLRECNWEKEEKLPQNSPSANTVKNASIQSGTTASLSNDSKSQKKSKKSKESSSTSKESSSTSKESSSTSKKSSSTPEKSLGAPKKPLSTPEESLEASKPPKKPVKLPERTWTRSTKTSHEPTAPLPLIPDGFGGFTLHDDDSSGGYQGQFAALLAADAPDPITVRDVRRNQPKPPRNLNPVKEGEINSASSGSRRRPYVHPPTQSSKNANSDSAKPGYAPPVSNTSSFNDVDATQPNSAPYRQQFGTSKESSEDSSKNSSENQDSSTS